MAGVFRRGAGFLGTRAGTERGRGDNSSASSPLDSTKGTGVLGRFLGAVFKPVPVTNLEPSPSPLEEFVDEEELEDELLLCEGALLLDELDDELLEEELLEELLEELDEAPETADVGTGFTVALP